VEDPSLTEHHHDTAEGRPVVDLRLIASRIAARLQARRNPRCEQLLFGGALAIFAAALCLSYRKLSGVALDWRWLALIAALVPVTLFLGGMEYQLCGRILGHRIRLGDALRISILSTAANLLPLPGALLVRTQALKLRGSKYGHAFSSTASLGGGWVATALLIAGGMQLSAGNRAVGLVFAAGGVLALSLTAALARLATTRVISTLIGIVILETVFVLVAAVRLYAALKGIGIDASATQAATLTIAAALASAAGIFPGGLGLRELIAGALSPLTSLPVAGGVLGAAVDRLIGLIVLSITAAAVLATSSYRHRAERHYPGDTGGAC
jgi:hypothetical protein